MVSKIERRLVWGGVSISYRMTCGQSSLRLNRSTEMLYTLFQEDTLTEVESVCGNVPVSPDATQIPTTKMILWITQPI